MAGYAPAALFPIGGREMKEIWKDIKGYEGRYQVSNLGRVKSLCYHHGTNERILKQKKNQNGYVVANLYKKGDKGKLKTVHRLVAEAFIPNPNNLPQINHKDEDKTNNKVFNLEWCDGRYNTIYSILLHKDKYKNCGKYIGRKNKYKEKNVKNGPYKHTKHVNQVDKDGNIINHYENIREVCLMNGYNQWSISECCNRKRKTAYGYKWEFAD